MLQPHRVDGIETGPLSAGQPPPQVQARNPHQHGEHASLALHARRVPIGAEQAAVVNDRRLAILTYAVEDDVKPARQEAREIFVLVVDRRQNDRGAITRGRRGDRTPQIELTYEPGDR
jgi:hypothetical protein